MQSLDDAVLPRLGRLHDARGARRAFEATRDAGYDNVSVDLMYGLPDLDLAVWTRSVEGVLAWAPEHLSAYGLTLDAGSLWAATGVEGLPPEGTVVEQYWALARAAAARRIRALRDLQLRPAGLSRRATTRSTGARPSTWRPVPGPVDSSATSGTAT